MKRAMTLLIISALVLGMPAGPALAHSPVCEWVSPTFAAEAVASEVGALVPTLAASGLAMPTIGYWSLVLAKAVVRQIDARYEVCID